MSSLFLKKSKPLNLRALHFLVVVLLAFPLTLLGQESEAVLGKWITVDEETGNHRSVVEIFKKGDELYGRIFKFIESPEKERTQRCSKCKKNDDRYDQLVHGMEIIRGLRWKKGKWEGGTILDPTNGKNYKAKIWSEDGVLKVRGYLAFFYRTQEWIRQE